MRIRHGGLTLVALALLTLLFALPPHTTLTLDLKASTAHHAQR